MRVNVDASPIEMPPNEPFTKIDVHIDVSHLLEELKLYDAVFYIELTVGNDSYHYSFVKRNITEPIVTLPIFVRGEISDLSSISYLVYMSYTKKE